MTPTIPQRRLRIVGVARASLVGAIAVILAIVSTMAGAPHARADNTVRFDDAGDAPRIGLLGDSTLSGVRWYDDYGDLEQYNFIFDAESCRRTVVRSCWSREQFRAESALVSMQRLSGEFGDVVVVMSGYNDPGYGFDEAVDGIVAEAKRQGIPKVLWLTLRTSEVSYEEPTHLANANTYREANRVLYQKADEYGGYLQVADWSSHAAGRAEWFEYDGVHLTTEGVDGVTSYIAGVVGEVLAGETVTTEYPAWVELEERNSGNTVIDAQEALLEAGISIEGGADGVYGDATAAAVSEFQADSGFDVTGTVDETTAVALGLHRAAPQPVQPAREVAPAVTEPAQVPPAVVNDGATATDEDDGGGGVGGMLRTVGLVLAGLVVAVTLRRRQVVARRAARARAHRRPLAGDRAVTWAPRRRSFYDHDTDDATV